MIDAGNDFNSVGITGGNHVSLRDTNALRLAISTTTGNLHADAGNVTIGGALTSSGDNLTLADGNSVTQLAHLSVTGAHRITVTAPSGATHHGAHRHVHQRHRRHRLCRRSGYPWDPCTPVLE